MTDRGSDWIQTFTGRQFYPLDPRPDEVDIVDIAHALSHLCRYGGHCKQFYSVAQHSLLVSDHVPIEHALWGLLHDASEAYLVDLPRPIKRAMPDYKAAELRLQAVICERFGLSPDEPAEVKRVDNAILADEVRVLLGPTPADWGPNEPPLGVCIAPATSTAAKRAFLDRFRALWRP